MTIPPCFADLQSFFYSYTHSLSVVNKCFLRLFRKGEKSLIAQSPGEERDGQEFSDYLRQILGYNVFHESPQPKIV